MLCGMPLRFPWAYGIGLALLSLAWVAMALCWAAIRVAGAVAGSHRAVDTVLKHGLVVAAARLLLPGLAAGVLTELGGPPVSPPIFGAGPGGQPDGTVRSRWLALLVYPGRGDRVSLWQRFGRAELSGAILLALALAALAAGTLRQPKAVAGRSAGTWRSPLVCSAFIWQRGRWGGCCSEPASGVASAAMGRRSAVRCWSR